MKQFEKRLINLSRHQSFSRIFDDFLQMVICALSHGQMEKEYLEIAGRYKSEELNEFAKAMGELFLDAESVSDDAGGWDDILGDCYMENVSRSQASNLGQFFTPTDICTLMAKMVLDDSIQEKEISVNDCACGSSRNLIAASRMHPSNRFHTFYVGQDLDYTCVMMSVLNYVMFGLKGVVIHMNTLTMEVYRGYRIYMPETGLLIRPLSKNQCLEFLLSQKEAEVIEEEVLEEAVVVVDKPAKATKSPVVVKKFIQTSLFD